MGFSEKYKKVIDYCMNNIMTERQGRFVRAYFANGWNAYKASKAIGVLPQEGNKMVNSSVVQLCLMLAKLDTEDNTENKAPSLEWTIGQYKEMYDKIKERLECNRTKVKDSLDDVEMYEAISKQIEEDEEALRKLLKLITDFQNKFGDMINQELINVNSYGLDRLIDMADKLALEVKESAGRLKWYEVGAGNIKEEGDNGKMQEWQQREREEVNRQEAVNYNV